MKKLLSIILILLILFLLTSCDKNNINNCTQPGSFFSDNPRFILIDETNNAGIDSHADIYCDTVTGVLYMYISNSYQGGITPLYNSDGSLILYDE